MSDVIRRRFGLALAALVSGVAAIGVSLGAAAQQADDPAWEDKPYTVTDGKVDFGTYNGYRRYEAYCLRCHGPDGAGSSYAPALVDSLKTTSYEDFLETVVYGRKNVSASQQRVTDLRTLKVMMTGVGAADLRHSITPYGRQFLSYVLEA
jgi:mono/diheme cytochrome c family protein